MSRFDAMTVNERLLEVDLLDAWDAALSRRDRADMIALLGQVALTEQATQIVDRVLANTAD